MQQMLLKINCIADEMNSKVLDQENLELARNILGMLRRKYETREDAPPLKKKSDLLKQNTKDFH